MQYTPKEISTIADKFKELVAERKIGFELDSFGNPVQKYSREAIGELTIAIKRLPSFPKRDVVENAMLAISTDYNGEILAAVCGDIPSQQIMDCIWSSLEPLVNESAFLEISEHLFTTKQIQAMLRQHPDYLKVRDADIKAGKLYAEEMEDMGKPETGIQSLSDFTQAFGRVA